jgi:tetratricopeptide (TPR) repeat protein
MVFQDIISNYGNQGPLHVLFGRAYRDANELDDAIHEFRLAIAVRPNTPYAHYFLGLALLMKREWGPPNDEIRGLIKAELKRAPRDFLSNYLMGMFASADKNFVEADRYLSVAADVNPSWPDPWLLMGQNAYDQHDFRRAQPLLEKAVALTGSDESRNHYQIRKAYIDLGRIAQEADRKEAGAEYFRKARELQQRNLQQSQQAVATVVSSGGGAAGMGAVMPLLDSREEEPVAPGLAALDPTAQIDSTILARANLTPEQQRQATAEEQLLRNVLGSSFNDLATSEAHRQQFSLALGHFQQAERWNPEVPGLLRNLGAAAFKVADHGEACRSLSKVLDSNPQDNVVRAMLGLSYFMTGAYGLAAQTLAPLSETALSDPALAYPWAESLVKTQNFAEAAKILDHIEQQQVSADTLVLVGEARNEMTDYAGALKAVHRALELNPSLPRAHFNAGLAYLRSAHPSEAATEFESELALNPGDSEAKYNLAYAYLQQSQRDKAVPLLEQVLAANPANADAQYQMGKLLLDENNVNNAIEHLEAAVRLSPEKDYVHYQLQSAYRKAARVQDADRELQLYKQAKNHKSTPDGNSPAQNQ